MRFRRLFHPPPIDVLTRFSSSQLPNSSVANNISDFCLWGSDTTGSELSTIGDIEGPSFSLLLSLNLGRLSLRPLLTLLEHIAATVAYCSTNDWGARLIKSGAITGVQVLRTQYYTQWTGYIDQTALHLEANDTGGELDPHGGQLAVLSSSKHLTDEN